jgi:hypothetical protein
MIAARAARSEAIYLGTHDNSMQRTALRAAADVER